MAFCLVQLAALHGEEEDDDDDDGCVENFGWYIDSISTKQELE